MATRVKEAPYRAEPTQLAPASEPANNETGEPGRRSGGSAAPQAAAVPGSSWQSVFLTAPGPPAPGSRLPESASSASAFAEDPFSDTGSHRSIAGSFSPDACGTSQQAPSRQQKNVPSKYASASEGFEPRTVGKNRQRTGGAFWRTGIEAAGPQQGRAPSFCRISRKPAPFGDREPLSAQLLRQLSVARREVESQASKGRSRGRNGREMRERSCRGSKVRSATAENSSLQEHQAVQCISNRSTSCDMECHGCTRRRCLASHRNAGEGAAIAVCPHPQRRTRKAP